METFDLLVSYFVLYYHCQSPEVSSSDSLLYFCLANKPVEKKGRKLARAASWADGKDPQGESCR